MSTTALSKLWSFFALALLTLSFLFFLRGTGMDPKGDSFGILGYKATTIPVLALPMDLALMFLTLWLTWVWATKVGGPTWAHRIPIFHFESKDIDVSSPGGRLYQAFGIGLTLFLPMLFTLQMASRFLAATVYIAPKDIPIAIVSRWGHFDTAKLSAVGNNMLRFGDANGPEYFVTEPWLLSACLLAVLAFWVVTVRSVFRKQVRSGG